MAGLKLPTADRLSSIFHLQHLLFHAEALGMVPECGA
jgi:hypothetical protein